MRFIMFLCFTLVYLATAGATVIAFLAQSKVIPSGLAAGETVPYLGLLLSAVLIESVGGYLALAKNLFGLKKETGKPTKVTKNAVNRDDGEYVCEEIKDRESLYRKAIQLIRKAESVFDTTWGPNAPKAAKKELAAKEDYLEARKHAIVSGKKYWELFSEIPNRKSRIEASKELAEKHPNYKIAILPFTSEPITMIDFLIADRKEAIISHVYTQSPQLVNRYLYIKSPHLAQLFSGLFDECWRQASKSRGVRNGHSNNQRKNKKNETL